MRKSVERTKLEYTRRHKHLRRALLWVLVPIAATTCGLLITYGTWQQQQADAALQKRGISEATTLKKFIATVEERKITKARAAEAAAKAKAIEDAAKQKASAAASPSGTTTTLNCDVTNASSITTVVNKKHCFKPATWAPTDLVYVDGYLMRSEAAGQIQAMMAAATSAGVGFGLSSTYRSYYDQRTTYNNWVAVNGSQAAADTVSARPGYSEHQTGLAADLKAGGCALECFASTAQYTWLMQNAANYGFIERYPVGLTSITGYSPEAWHWRYVGVATATDMKAKGIQTLEQYLGITGGDY